MVYFSLINEYKYRDKQLVDFYKKTINWSFIKELNAKLAYYKKQGYITEIYAYLLNSNINTEEILILNNKPLFIIPNKDKLVEFWYYLRGYVYSVMIKERNDLQVLDLTENFIKSINDISINYNKDAHLIIPK